MKTETPYIRSAEKIALYLQSLTPCFINVEWDGGACKVTIRGTRRKINDMVFRCEEWLAVELRFRLVNIPCCPMAVKKVAGSFADTQYYRDQPKKRRGRPARSRVDEFLNRGELGNTEDLVHWLRDLESGDHSRETSGIGK